MNARRWIFIAACVAGVAALAVILPLTLRSEGERTAPGAGDWPMPGGNPAHLSYLPLAPEGRLRELWSTRLEDEPAGPPAVAAGRVYAACRRGLLYCLDLETGRPLWRHDAEGGVSCMPAVCERGILVATSDGRVRLVSSGGKPVWEAEVGGSVPSTPIPEGDGVYFGSVDAHLYCLDMASGKKRWSFGAAGPVEVSPCVYEGQVFGVSYEGDLFALESGSGRLVWTFQSHAVPVACPAADGGRVFLATEFEIFCLDAQSGKLLWEYETGPTVISDLALRGSQVLVVIGGEGLLSSTLALDARTGDRLWDAASGETSARTRLYASNKDAYLCGRDQLRALSVDSGTPSFDLELPGVLPQTLTLTEERLLIGAQNRKVYCYGE
ncbi:MAG: PQQ-binding-like beta-propeller repeat protein [Actinomycetota bacterium]|nr:PQQ-binding-like beta-propeller repeat protein [Actinomycetota bacterium]